MMDAGIAKQDDPVMLAFLYTAPVTALVHLCDREPSRHEEVIEQIEVFIKDFIRRYL